MGEDRDHSARQSFCTSIPSKHTTRTTHLIAPTVGAVARADIALLLGGRLNASSETLRVALAGGRRLAGGASLALAVALGFAGVVVVVVLAVAVVVEVGLANANHFEEM